MGIIPKEWNKAVQKNGGLFNTVKSVFKEERLVTDAKAEALNSMEKKANLAYKNGIEMYGKNAADNVGVASAINADGAKNIRNTKAAFTKQSAKNAKNFDPETMTSASPWKNATSNQESQTRSIAATKATLKNTSAPLSNADEMLDLYNSAIRATKREAKARTVGNSVKNYYTKPFQDGRTGVGIARAGVTAAGIGTAGAITYSLSGAGNESYSSNNGNGSYDY